MVFLTEIKIRCNAAYHKTVTWEKPECIAYCIILTMMEKKKDKFKLTGKWLSSAVSSRIKAVFVGSRAICRSEVLTV